MLLPLHAAAGQGGSLGLRGTVEVWLWRLEALVLALGVLRERTGLPDLRLVQVARVLLLDIQFKDALLRLQLVLLILILFHELSKKSR